LRGLPERRWGRSDVPMCPIWVAPAPNPPRPTTTTTLAAMAALAALAALAAMAASAEVTALAALNGFLDGGGSANDGR